MRWESRVVEQGYDAVMEVVGDGRTVTEVAERWGVSRQRVYGWLVGMRPVAWRGWPTGRIVLAAVPIRSPPRWRCGSGSCAGGTLSGAAAAAPRARSGWSGAGAVAVGDLPGLVRQRLIEPVARRRRKADYRRWERDRPMELWQLEVLGGVWLADGQELKVVTGIDDHSRFWVMAGLVERANARSVCQVLVAALERYGLPDEVLTDNGKVVTGRLGPHPAEVLFGRICRQHGITHRCPGVRCPTTTGKIERFHKTPRVELFTGQRFASLAEAQQVLDAGWRATTPPGRTRPLAWPAQPNGSVPAVPDHQRRQRRPWHPSRPPTPDRRRPARPRSPGSWQQWLHPGRLPAPLAGSAPDR